MARIGRGHPRQTISGGVTKTAGSVTTTLGVGVRALGPRPPLVILPLPDPRTQMTIRTTLVAQKAKLGWRRRFPGQEMEPSTIHQTGSATVWGTFERMLGPDPPEVILPLPTLEMMTVKTYYRIAVRNRISRVRRYPSSYIYAPILPTTTFTPTPIGVELQAIARRVTGQRRQPHIDLFPPQLLALPPPLAPIQVTQVFSGRRRRRPLTSALFPPQFYPQTTTITVVPAAFAGRRRRGPFHSFLLPPIFYPATSTILVVQAAFSGRRRRAPFHSFLSPPQASATSAFFGPNVTLTRTRHRHVVADLFPPTALQLFPGPAIYELPLDRLSRRHRRGVNSTLYPPIFYPATSEITVTRVRVRPRPTRNFLTSVVYPQTTELVVATEPENRIGRIRRKPFSRLAPPTVLQVFPGPIESEVAVRTPLDDRRHRGTRSFTVAPVTYPQTTDIGVVTVRTRPRRTRWYLTSVSYPQTSAISVTLTRFRRRPTRSFLTPIPTTATTATFTGPEVTLTRVRRRGIRSGLAAPTTLQVFTGPAVYPARTRGRRLGRVVLTAVVYPAASTVGTHLVRTRPRRTIWRLTATSYPQTGKLSTALVRLRPRRTRWSLTNVEYPQQTPIEAKLRAVEAPVDDRERRRPRSILGYVSYPAAGALSTRLVRSRPRRTGWFLTSISYAQQTEVAVSLTRTRARSRQTIVRLTDVSYPTAGALLVVPARNRRRPVTHWFLTSSSAVVTFPPVVSTIEVVRAPRAVRRLSRALLLPPIFPPAFGTTLVRTVRLRPRRTIWRLTAVSYPQQTRIGTALVRIRPRRTRWFLTAVVYPQATPVIESEIAVKTAIDDRRRRATRSTLAPPRFYPATSVVSTKTTRTRPRRTRWFLTDVSYAQAGELSTRLVRTRPRRTIWRLTAVSYPAAGRLETTLARIRPRRTRSSLTAISYPQTGRIAVLTVRIRPRRTRFSLTDVVYPQVTPVVERLSAVPTPVDDRRRRRTRWYVSSVTYPATGVLRVLSVRTRPRQTRRFLTATFYPATGNVSVRLVRIRPRLTHTSLTDVSYPATGELAVRIVRVRPSRIRSLLALPVPPGEAFPPVETVLTVRLAPQRARRIRLSLLRPPTVLTTFGPVRVRLARIRPRPVSVLLSPAAVTAATAAPRIAPRAPLRPLRHVLSRLAPPTRLATFGGPSVLLTPSRRPRILSRLAAPAAAATSAAALRLARIPTRRPHTIWKLAPPTVVAPAPPAPVETTLVVVLTFQPRRLPVRSRLAPIPTLPTPFWTTGTTLPVASSQGTPVAVAHGSAIPAPTSGAEGTVIAAAHGSALPGPAATARGSVTADAVADGSVVEEAAADGSVTADAAAESEVVPEAATDGTTAGAADTIGTSTPGAATEGESRRNGT